MSKPDILAQLKAVAEKMDNVSSILADSSWPSEEVDLLCDTLTEAQTLLSNVTSTITELNTVRDRHGVQLYTFDEWKSLTKKERFQNLA